MSSIFDRYAPASINHVVFASAPLAKVVHKIVARTQHVHLLLHGDPGTGKSKMAELLIAEMYPPHVQTSAYIFDGDDWSTDRTGEILGSINANMADDQALHFSVINEVDRLSSVEIGDVRRFMDKHASHKFILTTNHAGKLPANFLNRCSAHQVDMEPATSVAGKVVQVFADHQLAISHAYALQIVGAAKGSWRTLEQLVHAQLP